jgi:glycosyltransferase involved in cell wall biosynthesis
MRTDDKPTVTARGAVELAVGAVLPSRTGNQDCRPERLLGARNLVKKRLVVDARWLRSGIGSYVINVLSGLRRHGRGLLVRAIAQRKDADQVRPLCDEIRFVDLPIYGLREQLEIPWAASDGDLLHSPHYNSPVLFPRKLLVTIHDLVHITDPTFRRTFAGRFYARPMLKLVAHRADHIIADSEYSKSQIVERLGASPEKVTVIHIGVNPRFRYLNHEEAFAWVATRLSIKRPFLLYVGNLKPHKNLVTLFRAMGLLRARRAVDHQLVIVGDDARWKEPLVRECVQLGIDKHVLFIPYVQDEVLPHVYAAAELLVLPSFIEGFGLPVVEAMACGTPVVCSRAASLPEVAGDAARFFDPSNVEDLAAAIEPILHARELREELCRKGLDRVGRFSWDGCAQRHAQLYYDLLGL